MDRTLDDRLFRLEPVFADDFKNAENWHLEGVDAKLYCQDGWLFCDARAGNIPAATIWCKAREFEDPLWLEYDIRFLDGHFNGNLFVHARENGGDVLATSDRRTGNYPEYHEFDNYLFTFLNDGERNAVRIRFRKNPGFNLLTETFFTPPLELNRTYHITIVVANGTVHYLVDGVKRLEFKDTSGPPLKGGRIGLRTWRTLVGWSDFRVYRILE